MTGLGRHLSAALVAIVMIAAQVLPAWAGCHSTKHATASVIAHTMVDVAVDADNHHRVKLLAQPQADADQIETSDPSQPTKAHLCLGNCGCACGLSGAFVLATSAPNDAPHGIALTRIILVIAANVGRTPDGPRRPPRTTA